MSSYFKFSHFIHRIFATQIRKPIPFTFQHSNFSDKATPVVSLKNSVIFSTPQPSQSDLISESADGNLPSIISPKLSDVIAKLSRELDTLPEDSSSSPSHIRPLPSALLAPVGNLAALVNECAALQRLMCEGIDLAALEAVPGVPNFLIKLDVEREIEPLVLFLSDTNRLALSCATGPALDSPAREPTQVGTVLQAAPRLLQVSIEELAIRLDYFRSKRFSWPEIRQLVLGAPTLLTRSVRDIDAQLGTFQLEFRLTGAEVRATVLRLPLLIVSDFKKIRDTHLLARRTLGFTGDEIRQLVLAEPSLLLASRTQLMSALELLHVDMRLPHERLALSPAALLAHPRTLRERHLFLRSVGRDQYDPTRPQYVSLEALARFDDQQFAKVAGVSIDEFHRYLKTR